MTNIRYQSIPIRENREPMLEAKAAGFLATPVYFEWGLTTTPHLFMREGLAKVLKDIEVQTLKSHQLRFRILDPWRPRALQRIVYEEFEECLRRDHPDWDAERIEKAVGVYVTSGGDPNRIPPHATGGSVDLTLCDDDGVDLFMGTKFDHFGPEAAPDYFEAPGRDIRVRDNRRLLKMCLKDAGINADGDEWWHYDFGNQKWAMGVGKAEAFYGEVADCALEKDGTVSCRFLQA